MKHNFVKTSSEDVYKELLSLKFTYLGKEGKYYCFLNDGKDVYDQKNVVQTNILHMSEA